MRQVATATFRVKFRKLTDALEFTRSVHSSTWKATCLRVGNTVYITVPKTRLKRLAEVVGIRNGEMKPFDRRARRRIVVPVIPAGEKRRPGGT